MRSCVLHYRDAETSESTRASFDDETSFGVPWWFASLLLTAQHWRMMSVEAKGEMTIPVFLSSQKYRLYLHGEIMKRRSHLERPG